MSKAVAPFSEGYHLVNADVREFSGDNVAAPLDFYDELSQYSSAPLMRIGTGHYWLKPERGIPAETVAVPDYVDVPEDEPVLMARNARMMDVVLEGGHE